MAEMNFGKIGILMGGPSTEREISLESGKAVYESLTQAGFKVAAIDIKTDGKQENIGLIKSHEVDVAFIAMHGRFCEDGQIQEILDTMGIPYTGSGVLASRLAMATRRFSPPDISNGERSSEPGTGMPTASSEARTRASISCAGNES